MNEDKVVTSRLSEQLSELLVTIFELLIDILTELAPEVIGPNPSEIPQ